MRGPRGAVAIVVSSLGLAGCATSALDMAPERADRPWTPATTANGEIVAGAPGTSDTAKGYVLPSNPALASIPPPPAVDAAKVYSLADLIDLAESSNPTTRIAWNDARRVALAAGIAQSAFLPQLAVSAVRGYQANSGRNSAAGLSAGTGGSASGSVVAASMQWLLFDFGERAALVDAAKQASVISNIAFTAAHQELIYAVSLAFYRNVAARARLATATQSLKNADAVQAAAEDRHNHGIGTVIEVAQARQGVAQVKLAVVEATGGAENAYLALLGAMGVSPLAKIRIADVSGRRLSPSLAAPVASVISESIARRPDVQTAYAAQKASLAGVQAAEAEFMPKLFVAATGTYNNGDLSLSAIPSVGQEAPTVNVSGSHLGGSLLAGISIPVYDGGSRAALLAQAQAESDSADQRMARVRDEAVRTIVLADNALRTSLVAVSASQALVSAAETTFNAALAGYRNGLVSVTDAILADTQLLQAKNASTDAYSTALAAAATLGLSTGTLGAAPR
jgi:outer membrane protein TolC